MRMTLPAVAGRGGGGWRRMMPHGHFYGLNSQQSKAGCCSRIIQADLPAMAAGSGRPAARYKRCSWLVGIETFRR